MRSLAIVRVVAMTSMALPVYAAERIDNPLLAAYCADVRKSDAGIVDSSQMPESADFVTSRVTEVLGQKLQEASRRMGIEGTVLLGLVVGADGKVQDARVLERSRYPSLDREALDLARGAQFVPARLNRKRVVECTHLQVTFRIAGS